MKTKGFRIPFNRSSLQGREMDYIRQAMRSGQIAGDQTFSKKCEKLLEKLTGCRRALLTTSCTHALEMAAILLNIREGDEVIVPAYTFVSTANAFVLRGARPVFCDIRPDTMNIDETLIGRLITRRTRAIVVVHYAGVACEMDEILALARRHRIPVVEDNAHGLFGKYRGRPLGSFGTFATLSFHETKNITCGEGGALLVNEPRYVARAEIIREKGTNRSRFFRGEVDKYSWVDIGSSYVMSDVLAAFLYGQLRARKKIQRKREQIWRYYDRHLGPWIRKHGLGHLKIPRHCTSSFHMFWLLLPNLAMRTRLIQWLQAAGIKAVFHYVPLNQSTFVRKRFGSRQVPLKNSVRAGKTLVRLPFYPAIQPSELEKAAGAALKFPFHHPNFRK
jgi:dTDP-4-amino-4,6-dideoxygalactose transaminase